MRKTILIIEDHPFMRTLLIQLFNAENYDVVCMDNAITALQWMNKNDPPSLIISDILMPEMDGFELLTNVRSSSFFQRIPVIIVSGLDKSYDRIKCLELGADDFITKPFNPEELLLKVNRLIKTTYYES